MLEVKWLDADEYAHWRRDGVDFTNTRLYRKLREFEVDEAIRTGDPEALGGLVRVTAPRASTSSTTSAATGSAPAAPARASTRCLPRCRNGLARTRELARP